MASSCGLKDSLLKVALVESACNPLVVEDSLSLSVEHVSDSDKFSHLLSLSSIFLLRKDFIVTIKLIDCVLVLILAIFGDLKKLVVVLLVGPDLPLHKGLSLLFVVQVDKTLLHPVHNMVMIGACVLPDQHRLVHHVTVAKVTLS